MSRQEAPRSALGDLVRWHRQRLGLTQEALAEKADISHRYLQSLEAGQKQPSINVVAQLRTALKCPWDELLKGMRGAARTNTGRRDFL